MTFRPKPDEELTIGDRFYHIAEHPAAPGMAYGQTGRRGTVYQLIDEEDEAWALKVFQRQYREPRLAGQAERIRAFTALPGLRVSKREVLTSIQHVDLIREHMDLAYAVLMPWIPGKTWMEIVVGREEWGADQSLAMVRSLLHILARMEERGIAHCDLSGPNLILTPEGQVELVDLEEMYATDLRRPIALPGGSPGYAHKTAPEGLWQPEADRFAGAILIAEMLGWCDARVKDAAWGEGYFEPKEMQTNCERYHLVKGIFQERWGDRLGELFEAAWFSDILSLCPTFTEWLAVLPEVVPEVVPEADREPEPEIEIEDLSLLILQAERATGRGEMSEALMLLKRAEMYAQGKLLTEIQARIAELEGVEAYGGELEAEKGWRCAICGRMVPDEAELCPYCEQDKRPGLEEGVAWEAGMFEEAIAFEGKEPSEVQLNELASHAQESTLIRQEKERIASEPFPIKIVCIWGAFVVIIIAAFFGLSGSLGTKEMPTEEPTEPPPTQMVAKSVSKQTSPEPTVFENTESIRVYLELYTLPGYFVAWGDYDQDGDLDLVAGCGGTDRNAHIYKNEPVGTFSEVQVLPCGGNIQGNSYPWVDYDGDNDLDLGIPARDASYIYRNDNGVFVRDARSDLPVQSTGGAWFQWGDLDGANGPDLVISGTNISGVYLNDGTGRVTRFQSLPTRDNHSADLGDYDNDGDLDLVSIGVVPGGGGQPYFEIRQNDDGVLSAATSLPGRAGDVHWVDYDGDGFLDIFIVGSRSETGSYVELWRQNPVGTFRKDNDQPALESFEAIGPLARNPGVSVWGDYDGDGDPDLFISSPNSGGCLTRTFQNDPIGTMVEDIETGLDALSICFYYPGWGDFDGDGDLELVAYDENEAVVKIFAIFEEG